MARILYGVHGTGHGHAMRALAIARHYPQHTFQFVSHSHGREALQHEYPVFDCPNPETPVSNHQVDGARALRATARILLRRGHWLAQVRQLIAQFKPDVAFSDYEFFVPRAARLSGIRCLSLDHQHVVTCGRHKLPASARPSYAATATAIRTLFSCADEYLVISFYRPDLRQGQVTAQILPPLLRPQLLKHAPAQGDHVVAYQGYETFNDFVPFLRRLVRPVRVYGLGERSKEDHLEFKPRNEAAFLADLAACRYVVCGGGHTLISEALYFGKPVVSIPIRGAFEQYLNALYVERLGYGVRCTARGLPGLDVPAFEKRLPTFHANIARGDFCGNAQIFAVLDRFIAAGTIFQPDSRRVCSLRM